MAARSVKGVGKLDVGVFYCWQGEGPQGQWPAQLPEQFKDVRMHFRGNRRFDYVFVLNDVLNPTWVKCDPDRIWGFVQEPPTPFHSELHTGRPYMRRVYTTDESLPPPRYQPFWSALKWATGLTYDELRAEPYPDKTINLSWVTSNQTFLPGHQKRMAFLSALQAGMPDLRLYGRGFRTIARKWDALAPARYSIAFENFGGGIYWSEKLTDCFLSYATPIYYGARNIDRYFPPNSYITFDPDKAGSVERVREIVTSDFHEENREAMLEARELCLTRYNTLFYLAGLALAHHEKVTLATTETWQRLTPAHPNPAWMRLLRRFRELAVSSLPPAVTTVMRSAKHRLLGKRKR